MNQDCLIFDDYKNWNNTNNDFTYYDYISVYINKNKIHPDFLVIYSMLFYPEFLLKDDMIFIKENFKENYFNQLVTDKVQKNKIEYWMNLILLASFFPDNTFYDKHAEYITKIMKETISKKLECEFKNKKFKVVSGIDEDDGPFFYFHQV